MTSRRTRQRLLDRLRASGISDERVLHVINTVPRHYFVDEAVAGRAYEDIALPIGHNQTISQPLVVALMTQLLLEGGRQLDKVLEIGTGSGYQTAVLASLDEVHHVYTIERIDPLLRQARERLFNLRLHKVHYLNGDGTRGWADNAPYDGILVAAAPVSVPDALLQQLAVGGRLIIPVGSGTGQQLTVITRTPRGFEEQLREDVRFVPLVSDRV